MMHEPRAALALPAKSSRVTAENAKCPKNIYFGTVGMYFGTLARTTRDESIASPKLARCLGTLKPWSQQQFRIKALYLY